MNSVTVSVRVPKRLKEELSRYGVEVSRVVREALEEEVRRRRLEEFGEIAGELGELFAKVPEGEIVRGVRETRRSR